jgi:hypothetical protein
MSEAATTEPPANRLHQLSATGFRVIVHKLRNEIPSPDSNDDEIALLVDAAIAEVASMLPANIEEAKVAARAVSADAQASDCIRHARLLFNDHAAAMRCHAQASLMMRTANAARALLLRLQTARHKREAVPANCDKDAWTEHCAAGLMADRRDDAPTAPPPAAPPPSEDAADRFARYDQAEQYAVLYPQRAAEIRAYGGVPPTASYGPPEPELVCALIASTSPILRKIDQDYARPDRA